MDFFDTINSTREFETMYSHWYASLPEERRAQMFCDMVNFGIESVKYNALKDNPFLSTSEQTMAYVRSNLKNEVLPETFAFIEAHMAERAEREWQERFKEMKKALGWSYEDMAKYMGAESGNSVKASVNRKLPAFAKLAVCVFEQMQKNQTPNR